jgi:6-pyruvoyltetrahydropterin/6-carboxytetrahydropterin synthase
VSETYRVRVAKDYLVFSAAHFITFNGNVCERLHGHNYKVQAEIAGPLDENHYVIDFIALRDRLKQIVDRLDHHVLLPLTHPLIRVVQEDSEVVATFEQRRWVFPRDDCVLLPIANTTAELLAKHIGELLLASENLSLSGASWIRIGVDENEGQWAFWEMAREEPRDPRG